MCQFTRACTSCTSTARCGACRSAIFKLRQATSVASSCASPPKKQQRRQSSRATPPRSPATDDRLGVARDLAGYQCYLALLESEQCGVTRAGALAH